LKKGQILQIWRQESQTGNTALEPQFGHPCYIYCSVKFHSLFLLLPGESRVVCGAGLRFLAKGTTQLVGVTNHLTL